MQLIPFHPSHLSVFTPGQWDEAAMRLGNLDDAAKRLSGLGVSAIEDGRTLGIGAIVGNSASLLLSDELRARPVILHRTVKRVMDGVMNQLGMAFIEATAHRDFTAAHKWLERLGFKMMDNTEDYWRYRYVRR
jgi:uncharacterized protein YjeT (DUF2065 family)